MRMLALPLMGLLLLWPSAAKAAALPGDVDGDGRVGVSDVLLVLRAVVGTAALTPTQTAAADVSPQPRPDGVVTLADAMSILRVAAGLSGPPPPGGLTGLVDSEGFALTEGQWQVLRRQGFVITPSRFDDLYQVYKDAVEESQGVFVTTDSVLHAYHVLFSFLLRTLEVRYLEPQLRALTLALIEASWGHMALSSSFDVSTAGRSNLAYFCVAARLLDPDYLVPRDVEALVEEELALIDAHEGFRPSPLLEGLFTEDYSQYVPRGHYTRNETLRRYFRAMMWYGRMPFHLRPGTDPEKVAFGLRKTRQALLLLSSLLRTEVGGVPALEVWESIYKPTAFLVGSSDDLDVYAYRDLLQRLFGDASAATALNVARDDQKLARFVEEALKLRRPKIVSEEVGSSEEADQRLGFRFMGRRFIPDSYMLQQLVHDKVPGRLFPRGLDVMSVLGSPRAAEILEGMGETKYPGYVEQVTKLREEFGGLTNQEWSQNVYWSWLNVLRPLGRAHGPNAPAFMCSPAWADKELVTALGSWTELRHDTLLYAKQSTSVRTSVPEEAYGYVEPNPEVYRRLLALSAQTRGMLSGYAMLPPEFAAKLQSLEDFVALLLRVSEQELAGVTPSDEDFRRIQAAGSVLEAIQTFSAEVTGQVAGAADARMALVADVHTDPNSGQVLEEAVGKPQEILVVVQDGRGERLTRGAVFSYYEFLQPMSDRLTDEAWQQRVDEGRLPAAPGWTQSLTPAFGPQVTAESFGGLTFRKTRALPGSQSVLTVERDGRASYEVAYPGEKPVTFRATLSAEQMRDLLAALTEAELSTLERSYMDPLLAGAWREELTVQVEGISYTVDNYGRKAPARYLRLSDLLDRLGGILETLDGSGG